MENPGRPWRPDRNLPESRRRSLERPKIAWSELHKTDKPSRLHDRGGRLAIGDPTSYASFATAVDVRVHDSLAVAHLRDCTSVLAITVLLESDLFFCPPETSNATNSGSSSTASSKVNALLKLLVASRDESPSRKSIIFSQFRKMLLLLEEPLKAAALEGPTILLVSLKASGAGINLTAATKVYLIEPWWNQAIEEQAMDRVHRIGQKEDVKILRMIARSTIEERILELQE
ncbi:hypothetical protein RND71_021865 [Anisodus tanguticus]|uniref:Helicase C-terminal domain-containing protein n=1 Tax=Anisodus tanguticus TaxID=243964 RepID=A0AAE1VDC2_9SOLA|nr:hypothetical protein RND71_021865 [Anisodus tanguticus]